MSLDEMLNLCFWTKKVEEKFGGMKNISYLCIVNQKVPL